MREQFQVAIDLAMLVGHRGAQFAVAIQDAESGEPVVRGTIQDTGVFLVVLAGRGLLARGLVADEPRRPGFAGDELPVGFRRAQQRAADAAPELFAQPVGAFGQRQVLRRVARIVAEGEREMRLALERDAASENLAGRVRLARGQRQEQTDECAAAEACGSFRNKAFDGVGLRHARSQYAPWSRDGEPKVEGHTKPQHTLKWNSRSFGHRCAARWGQRAVRRHFWFQHVVQTDKASRAPRTFQSAD